jgi:hypothetical protein
MTNERERFGDHVVSARLEARDAVNLAEEASEAVGALKGEVDALAGDVGALKRDAREHRAGWEFATKLRTHWLGYAAGVAAVVAVAGVVFGLVGGFEKLLGAVAIDDDGAVVAEDGLASGDVG